MHDRNHEDPSTTPPEQQGETTMSERTWYPTAAFAAFVTAIRAGVSNVMVLPKGDDKALVYGPHGEWVSVNELEAALTAPPAGSGGEVGEPEREAMRERMGMAVESLAGRLNPVWGESEDLTLAVMGCIDAVAGEAVRQPTKAGQPDAWLVEWLDAETWRLARLAETQGSATACLPPDDAEDAPQMRVVPLYRRSALLAGERRPSRDSERAKVVERVGECCRGADPACSAGCLVERALLAGEREGEAGDVEALAKRLEYPCDHRRRSCEAISRDIAYYRRASLEHDERLMAEFGKAMGYKYERDQARRRLEETQAQSRQKTRVILNQNRVISLTAASNKEARQRLAEVEVERDDYRLRLEYVSQHGGTRETIRKYARKALTAPTEHRSGERDEPSHPDWSAPPTGSEDS